MPAFPGAQKRSTARGDVCLMVHAIACSRPPEPMISIFICVKAVAARRTAVKMAHLNPIKAYRFYLTQFRHRYTFWPRQPRENAQRSTTVSHRENNDFLSDEVCY